MCTSVLRGITTWVGWTILKKRVLGRRPMFLWSMVNESLLFHVLLIHMKRFNQELLAGVKESEEITNSQDSDIIRVQSGSWGLRFMVHSERSVWQRFFFLEKEAVRSCFLGRDTAIASALASRSVGRVRPSAMAPNWPAPRQKEKQTPQALT